LSCVGPPTAAAQRARNRESLLTATENELDKVSAVVDEERGTCATQPRADRRQVRGQVQDGQAL
jgi:hypothetical protein